jgi:hypothetical protein
MKISSIPKSGRKGSVVYVNSRHGKVARQYVRPRDPRTPDQQRKRGNLVAVCKRWRTLTTEQRAAWRIAAANNYFVTETGRRVRLNGYDFFVSLNMRRSDITELYVARYGVPKAGTAIWIRTCQHIDGWTDVPKVARARVPAAASPITSP